jgi:hypothetical protein
VKGIGCSGDGEINIYPNPAHSGQFTVHLFSNVNEEAQLIIINTLGQRIYKTIAATNKPIAIDIEVIKGVYTVLAITAHGKCIEKVTVAR